MTVDTFFENFDLFAEIPDAVVQVRNLILELAVRGRLCNQDPADSSDPDWKQALGSLRSEPDEPPGSEAHPFAIPASWRWSTLNQVGDTKPRNRADDLAQCAFVPMTLIQADYGSPHSSEVRHWGEIKKGFTHFQEGDVVLAKITPCFENGKSAVMRNLPGGFGAGTTELHVLRPNQSLVDQNYVVAFLKSQGFIDRGIPRMTGSAGQKRIPHDYFANAPFPLAPLAEQKRIVAKVNELMALCDRLEAQQKERETKHAALAQASLSRFAENPTSTNLNFLFHPSYTTPPKALRQLVLSLAVQGKLIAQDPTDRPARALLDAVLQERDRTGKAIGLRPAEPVQADPKQLSELPANWCYASPDELTALKRNAIAIGPFGSSLLKSDYSPNGVPLIFVREIRSESFGRHETKFVSPQKAVELAAHTVLSGDVLVTKMGDPPGDTSIYPEGLQPAIITADCIKLTPHAGLVMPEYLRYAIRSPQIANQLSTLTMGVAQQKISLGRFRSIAVPLPPLAEQQRIVEQANNLLTMIDELESGLACCREKAASLLDAVVSEFTTLR